MRQIESYITLIPTVDKIIFFQSKKGGEIGVMRAFPPILTPSRSKKLKIDTAASSTIK